MTGRWWKTPKAEQWKTDCCGGKTQRLNTVKIVKLLQHDWQVLENPKGKTLQKLLQQVVENPKR